jgi:hypothetical protein
MEQVIAIYTWIIANGGNILLAVTSIVTGASIIAKLTPTQVDDEFLAKVVKVLDWLALNKSRL